MHAPKNNVFAYICCMLLGAVFIFLGAQGRFTDALANIILMIIGGGMMVGYAVVIFRHLKARQQEADSFKKNSK